MLSRTRQQQGFTLVELLVSMTVGLVVIGAAMTLVSYSANASKRVTDRVDATQQARLGLDRAVQRLRAIACPEGQPPLRSIVAAGRDRIFFHADLDADQVFDPEQHAVRIDGGSTGRHRFTSSSWAGRLSNNLPGTLAATSTQTLTEATTGLDVFSYWVPLADGTDLVRAPTDAAGNVAQADLARIARIDIELWARPTATSRDTRTTVVAQSSVYPRAARYGATAIPTFGC